MTLEEFRNRRYIPIWLLTFEQNCYVTAAHRWGDSAYAWMNVGDSTSTEYAIKAAKSAFKAFPELRS